MAGGGVILYVRENLKAKVLDLSNTTQWSKPLKPEYLFCEVWEGNAGPILLALIYRPPDVSLRADSQLVKLL